MVAIKQPILLAPNYFIKKKAFKILYFFKFLRDESNWDIKAFAWNGVSLVGKIKEDFQYLRHS